MTTLTPPRGLRPAIRRSLLNAALTSTGCASLLLAAAGVHAQQQPAANAAAGGELGEIVVTGIRHGIEDAIVVKRDSGSIVEAVSAEDIGKLPDTSIAESISRLPGLTSQRAEGRASSISLRGTDPGFTTALMNGREQVSTGDNRSIEFDQYPSELLSGVVVYKTPDAQLIGQGLAGTIELKTARPIEYGKTAFAVNLRGEQNGNGALGADSTDRGYRASVSYIDQFADHTVGLAIGYARLSSPLATEGVGTYEPWSAGSSGFFTTGGMKVRTDMGKNVRDGAMATLEWKPSETFTSTLDVYYTKSNETDDARSIEVNLGGYPAPCCDGTFPAGTVFGISNGTISNATVTGGTLNTVLPLVRNFQFITDDKIIATGWNNKWSSGGLTLAADLSYSKATRDQFQPETNAEYVPLTGQPAGAPVNQYDTGQYHLYGDSMPSLTFGKDYTNAALVQIGPTIYGTGYAKLPHVEDKLTSGRIDVGYDVSGWFDNVSAGINYADRSKDKRSPESGLSTIGGGFTQIDSKYLLTPTNLSYAGAPNVLAWNVPSVLGAYYKPIVWGDPSTLSYLVGKWWTVKEKLATAFVKGNLNHELSSSVTLKGNVGLQLVNTDQSSDAFFSNTATGKVTPFTAGKKYTDVLPEINLVFSMPEQQAVRLSLAREVARPRMDQLKASREWGVSSSNGLPGGSQGNPLLDPWRANAIDVSYEKYFGHKGYFSAAAFMKQLKSYIYDQSIGNYDFSSLINSLPPGYFPPGLTPKLTGNLTQPVNGSGGNLKGLELTGSVPGDMLADGLRDFGAILSISQTQSDIETHDIQGNNVLNGTNLGTIPLPGLSKTVWSATLYYEKSGYSARIATRARSKYIGEVTNFANDRAIKFIKGDQITDFQTSYEFDAGALKGLMLLFQVNNMTNSPYITYQRVEAQQIDFQTYGRQFLVGVNYKL